LSKKKGFEIIKNIPHASMIKTNIETKLSLTFENYRKLYKLSPEMTAFMGKNRSTKREITDKIWNHCKKNSLLNKSEIELDNVLKPLFGKFVVELAKKEKEEKKELKQKTKKESEFKINLGQLTKQKTSANEVEKESTLRLCELNTAIFEHIISIAPFEFKFEIPMPNLQHLQIENSQENMDEYWKAFDVFVRVQSENINEAMPFFVQKVIFEDKEREKILNSVKGKEFNKVMIVNEQVKLDNQRLLNLRGQLSDLFTTFNLQNQVNSLISR
jgi:hypothetical protein